jgi:multidrug efflux system membrane fusion protein
VLKDYVTKSQADQAVAAAVAQKAVVEADKATIDNARFNLENATITAPISGKTGSLLVKQGNLVKPGAAPALVVINQLHPILVHFSVPDRDFPDLQKYAAAGELKVRATPRGGVVEEGALSFLDNGVDTTTGAITIKAKLGVSGRASLCPSRCSSMSTRPPCSCRPRPCKSDRTASSYTS